MTQTLLNLPAAAVARWTPMQKAAVVRRSGTTLSPTQLWGGSSVLSV